MPLHNIIILSLIVTVFTAFAVVLAGLSWYCRDQRPTVHQRHRHDAYPRGADIIVDD